jgi:2-oxoglutarate ferredoxin oxidoreductase subunit beta
MKKVFSRPKSLTKIPFHYCAGCDHPIAHRLIAEIIDELEIRERLIAVWPIGCSVMGDKYFDLDSILASHGKAPAVATGVALGRLTNPDVLIFTYQGDGDMVSIGLGEIIHAANRGELFTAFFINNAIYAMTSGQMAPTTVVGQKTKTCPLGRDPKVHGYPIRMCELLQTLLTPAYIARVALFDAKHINKAKKAIRKAFQFQMDGKGFSFVEIISACPTNWKAKYPECREFIKEKMLPVFPLKEFKTFQIDNEGEKNV